MDNLLAIYNALRFAHRLALAARVTTSPGRLCLAATLLLALVIAGCGKSPFELAEATGTVTIDGQPFAQGKVMFAPVASGATREAGKPAFGNLQSDGSFTLRTDDRAGAVVGQHWATVIAIVDADAPTTSPAPKFSRVAVPQSFLVEAGKPNQFEIKLSRQDIAKFGQK
jgi:hypothetical protein